jgi:hypothetical protein
MKSPALHQRLSFRHWLTAAICLFVPTVSRGITLDQADTFQDGGLDGWVGGGAGAIPSAQMNIPSGGPTGAGDKYLQLSAGGTGGSSRLLGVNQMQWIGDYLTAGVAEVGMDLLNPGTNALSIRVAIREGTGSGSTPGYVSTSAFPLPGDNHWHHAVFRLDASDLTGVNSPAPLSSDLASVTEFRILDATNISLQGDQFSTSLPAVSFGVDNIAAVPPVFPADFNRDGRVGVADIQAMLLAIADLSRYQTYWNLAADQLTSVGDLNHDEIVTNADVQGLIDNLANSGASGFVSAVPEPASSTQCGIGGLVLMLALRARGGAPKLDRD